MKPLAAGSAILVALLSATPVRAQSAPSVEDRPLTTTYSASLLRDLPTNDSLFSVIDALQPSIISDRFTAGGLETGQPARLGGFLSSWTQTMFRIDGVPVTDPSGNGAPLLLPELALWDNIRVGTGLFDINTNATGLAIDLMPLAPSARWARRIEASTAHAGLAGRAVSSGPPAIARLDGWDRVSAIASGPLLADRLSAAFATSWTHASQFSKSERFAVSGRVASAMAHLVFTPNTRDTIRTFAWLQQSESPLSARNILSLPQATTAQIAGHAQAVWEHGGASDIPWRAYASYGGQRRTPEFDAAGSGDTERLADGPVTQFASLANGTVQMWSLGVQATPTPILHGRPHALHFGLDATGGRSEASSFFSGTIGELVDQSPARVWVFKGRGTPSIRHTLLVGASADDRIALTDRLALEAGLRFQSAGGSAEGAASSVSWRSLLPRVRAQWQMPSLWRLTAFAGYSRSAYRLGLDDLAFGDPSASTADVYRWNALGGPILPLSARGALVARVGPGTGGDPAFSAIDPGLKTPTADELAIGVDVHPLPSLLLRVTGVTRREGNLPSVVNTGAAGPAAYASFTASSPGSDVLSAADDQVLTIYNRLPASFGQDRYLLTTPAQQDATFKGLELTIRWSTAKLLLTGGATAGIAESSAANLGYGPLENDQGLLGELSSDPNAAALARGRPFTDRAYTAKFAVVYTLPARTRLGVVARYQDGQPFARVIVFPGLRQGAEPVRAFSNGDSRFTFVGTLDARVQKAVTIGTHSLDVILDAYNLLGMSGSVEENVAASPDVRVTTAVQPPRAIHLGVRFAF